MRARRLDIDRVQRLARGHEQPVAPRAAEADVGAGLRQANHADALAVGRDDLNAGPRARPDVAVGVAANAVGRGRRAGAGNVELNETLAVAQRLAVDVPDLDLARRAGVGDIELLVVGREADAVGPADFVGDLVDLRRSSASTR